VDYLQLMTAGGNGKGGGNREQEYLHFLKFKSISKELNVPVIALSQLSRAVETRGSSKDLASDLRESGAIEQDADIVSFYTVRNIIKLTNGMMMKLHPPRVKQK
jgi:replicative DNA helicase